MTTHAENPGWSVPSAGKALVAVDMGAESCRVSLLRWVRGKPEIRLVHRFPNGAIEGAGGLKWDLARLVQGIETGLRCCAAIAGEGIAAIGVDGWAVDYVRLGADAQPLADPFCYRDERTITAEHWVHQRISREKLYELTGVQLLRLNTIYQLVADNLQGGDAAAPWVNLPEYVLHHLGGARVAEYTNATHTQLVARGTRRWCEDLFDLLGLRIEAAPPIVPPGAAIGKLAGSLAALPALSDCSLIAPACHDTAAAIAGIPASGYDWAFISSGTWSLVGAVLGAPCVAEAARTRNYTNLGGVGGTICFLKNVNGLWLIRQCQEEWARAGKRWTAAELVTAAGEQPAPAALLDVDDPELLMPGQMPARINAQRARAGHTPLSEAAEDAPAMASLIFHSLAARYAQIIRDVGEITGKPRKRLFIVGGGNRNEVLNRLTAAATGLEVLRGPAESSTIGNLAIQLASLGGAWSEAGGADAAAVAHWASVLASAYADQEEAVATTAISS